MLDEATLEERKLTGARTDGVAVLLVRKGARVFALADRCSHRGCALHEGRLNDDNGVEAIRRLRELGSTARVFVTTGVDDPAMLQETRAAGADALVAKPPTREDLLTAIVSE